MSQVDSFCDVRSARTRALDTELQGVRKTDTTNVVMGEPAFIWVRNPILTPDSRPASVEAQDSPYRNKDRLQHAENRFSLPLFLCQHAGPVFQFYSSLDPTAQDRFSFGFYSNAKGPETMNGRMSYDHYDHYAIRSHFGSSLNCS